MLISGEVAKFAKKNAAADGRIFHTAADGLIGSRKTTNVSEAAATRSSLGGPISISCAIRRRASWWRQGPRHPQPRRGFKHDAPIDRIQPDLLTRYFANLSPIKRYAANALG